MNNSINVLIIGSGGREHALFKHIQQSPLLKNSWVMPGNGGIPSEKRVNIDSTEQEKVVSFCESNKIDLVVIGPEKPLVEGLSDRLDEAGIMVFGPDKYCAQLEGSKEFAKKIMNQLKIPTAQHAYFTDYENALKHIQNTQFPTVVKADGLAAGKGVIIAQDISEATNALKEIFLDKAFGNENAKVVIEDFLVGEECSLFAICDGNTALTMKPAQDHKQVGEGDTGPNTGGMGAYVPAPIIDDQQVEWMRATVFQPILDHLKANGHPYKGLLYAGLMVSKSGDINILEFNCRFGDPETQIILPALADDLLQVLLEAAHGKLKRETLKWHNESYLTVVLAADGYPAKYAKNISIKLDTEWNTPNEWLIHAGTETGNKPDEFRSTGGRVLNVVAKGNNLLDAQAKAYKLAAKIVNPQLFFRKDIGFKAIKK